MIFPRPLLKAIIFATAAHDGQKRKFTLEPYIAHPLRVAHMVAHHGGSDEAVISSLLHDVLEDSSVTLGDLIMEFGSDVAGIVFELTNERGPAKNRAARKAKEVKRAAGMSPEAKMIRLADIVDNVPSIVKHGKPEFAALYVAEKKALLQELTGGGREALYIEVCQMLYGEEI